MESASTPSDTDSENSTKLYVPHSIKNASAKAVGILKTPKEINTFAWEAAKESPSVKPGANILRRTKKHRIHSTDGYSSHEDAKTLSTDLASDFYLERIEKDAEIKSLRQELHSKNRDIDDLEHELDMNLGFLLKQSQRRVEDLEEENSSLRRKLEADEGNRSLRAKFEANRIAELETKLACAEEFNAEAGERIIALGVVFADLREKSEEQAGVLGKVDEQARFIVRCKKEIANLSEERSELLEENESLQDECEKKTSELDRLRTEITTYRARNDRLARRVMRRDETIARRDWALERSEVQNTELSRLLRASERMYAHDRLEWERVRSEEQGQWEGIQRQWETVTRGFWQTVCVYEMQIRCYANAEEERDRRELANIGWVEEQQLARAGLAGVQGVLVYGGEEGENGEFLTGWEVVGEVEEQHDAWVYWPYHA